MVKANKTSLDAKAYINWQVNDMREKINKAPDEEARRQLAENKIVEYETALVDCEGKFKEIRKKQNVKMVDRIKDVSFEKILNIDDAPKLTKKEIKVLKEKTKKVQKGEDVKFDKKEKQFINYTIRLDLGELKKEIDENVNGD